MKTYSVDLRHAASKRALNATPDNRLDPLRTRMEADAQAIEWARGELMDFARHRSGEHYQYVEAAVIELLPIGRLLDGKDYRRLGRWVCNADGLIWRPSAVMAGNLGAGPPSALTLRRDSLRASPYGLAEP